ncbi:MAG: rhodanese-like domain-containing protein [Ignavibacteria bacterium]|nr:rhodanese-like domain-containing protein [Ignavibacteria bacterium]
MSCNTESEYSAKVQEAAIKQAAQSTLAEPWTDAQLMQPATLAKMLTNNSKNLPHVYSIGRVGAIKNSIAFGPAQESENLNRFKAEIQSLPRDAAIVIYCGCCPFEDCPNIRPAFSLLNEMGFTNHKLLNLTHNLNVDWIDKGYPVNK